MAAWCETHCGNVMWNTLWQRDVKHIMAAWCETHYGSVMWNTLWQCDVKHIMAVWYVKHIMAVWYVKHIMAVWYVKHIMALPIKATTSVLKVPTYYYHSLSYLTHCDTSDNIHLDLHKYSYSICKWSLISLPFHISRSYLSKLRVNRNRHNIEYK